MAEVTELRQNNELTPANIKSSDRILEISIATLTELIAIYESDKLQQLKKKDAILNIQVIPNVDRIKIEKAMVAQDFQKAKE